MRYSDADSRSRKMSERTDTSVELFGFIALYVLDWTISNLISSVRCEELGLLLEDIGLLTLFIYYISD